MIFRAEMVSEPPGIFICDQELRTARCTLQIMCSLKELIIEVNFLNTGTHFCQRGFTKNFHPFT
jgi:hypothetical protein